VLESGFIKLVSIENRIVNLLMGLITVLKTLVAFKTKKSISPQVMEICFVCQTPSLPPLDLQHLVHYFR
jgi:hypothetical protein